MRYAVVLILFVGLFVGCGSDGDVKTCLDAGGTWDASARTCAPTQTTTTATPTPELTATPTPEPTATPTPELSLSRWRDYVVRIEHPDGCASGVMLGRDGLILTNHHVVDGKEGLIVTTDKGTAASVRVLVSDRSRDLALVQASTTLPEPKPLSWGDETSLDLGAELFVLGHPLCSPSITLTRGIFSGRTRIRGQPLLQTDAALNPGVSGGLVVTANGTAVGIAVSGFTERENVGFLIPASQIERQVQRWLTQIATGQLDTSSTSHRCPGASDTADEHIRKGYALATAGNYEAAIIELTLVICLQPSSAGGYMLRGLAYAVLGEYERAIQDFDEAIRLDPHDADAYNNRGFAYYHLGQYERAIQDYDEAIHLDPQDFKYYYNRGLAYLYLDQYERAIQNFDEAIRLNSKDAKAYNNRGDALHHLGQYERAIQDYDEAIRLNPQNAKPYYGRGLTYQKLGQMQRANQDFDEAIRLDPSLKRP